MVQLDVDNAVVLVVEAAAVLAVAAVMPYVMADRIHRRYHVVVVVAMAVAMLIMMKQTQKVLQMVWI